MVKSMVEGMVVVVVVGKGLRISKCFGLESVVGPPVGAQVCREQRGDLNVRRWNECSVVCQRIVDFVLQEGGVGSKLWCAWKGGGCRNGKLACT